MKIIRYWLLIKRMLMKPSYVIMLILIPVFVFTLSALAKDEPGIFSVGVVAANDEFSTEFVQRLLEDKGNLQILIYKSKNEAKAAVEREEIAQAWIIPNDFDESFEKIALGKKPKKTIEVLVTEDNVSHMIAREILLSKLYPYMACEVYDEFMQEHFFDALDEKPVAKNLIQKSQEQRELARTSYESYELKQPLFQMQYVNLDKKENKNVILAPMRGIFSLWLLICGLLINMYYILDTKNGLFIYWKNYFVLGRTFFYYLCGMLLPSIVTLMGLRMLGLFTTFSNEMILLLSYDLAIIIISNIFRKIFPSHRIMSFIIPVIAIFSAVFTPVFININIFRGISRFFAGYYYLNGVHDIGFMFDLYRYMFVLLVVMCIIIWCDKIFTKLRRI